VVTTGSRILAPALGSVSLPDGGSAVLRFEINYIGATGSAKEVLIDSVALTPVS
jgi:hypothetical protein